MGDATNTESPPSNTGLTSHRVRAVGEGEPQKETTGEPKPDVEAGSSQLVPEGPPPAKTENKDVTLVGTHSLLFKSLNH